MHFTAFIENCLKEAAEISNKSFGKVTGTTKPEDNNQVLTETDLAIGKLLVEKVKQAYPEYNIIDEETGIVDNGSEFTWVIDPIDGTSNFANGVPTYGSMIGLLHNDKPIAGGLSVPYTKELCLAEKDKGTFLNRKKVSVTKETNLLNCLVAYHIDGHQEKPEMTREEAAILGEIILHIRNMRNTGSEPVDAILVASGRYGALLNRTMKIWDVVAPQIIIEEAGGMYTDFWGNAIDYSHPLEKTKQNFTMCAAPPALHKQLQNIIHQNN